MGTIRYMVQTTVNLVSSQFKIRLNIIIFSNNHTKNNIYSQMKGQISAADHHYLKFAYFVDII